jgi:hypothetical protein
MLLEEAEVLPVQARQVLGVGEHHVVAVGAQDLGHRPGRLGVDGVGDVGDEEADGPGLPPHQALRHAVGSVVQGLDGTEDGLADLGTHVGIPVEDARDGRP